MQDIADACGLGIVIALVDNFGGLELRIPHSLTDDHKLMVLGRIQAEALCSYCPGDTIHVPITLDRKRLKRQVDDLETKGFNRQEIARELGISQRHVRRLANKEGPDDGQLDMFSDL